MLRRNLLLMILFVCALSLLGMKLPGLKPAKVNLPQAANLDSAFLHIHVFQLSGDDQTVNIHRITADWTEMNVTWNSFAGSFDPNVDATFVEDRIGWFAIDVTSMVQDWMNGFSNFGLLLKRPDFEMPRTSFASREWADTTLHPFLELVYSDGTTEQITPLADSYIRESDPDKNYGTADELFIGGQVANKKETLIRFEVDVTSPAPRTPGYWKTHSIYGPAPYDDTWANIGEDTIFFLSADSYHNVLWTPPKGGNAYFILAHAYIATELNDYQGTPIPSDISDAIDDATRLFELWTPADIGALKGDDPLRQEFIDLAGILDEFNNGN